jgi:hypothetical protein
VFGLLTVLSRAPADGGRVHWLCACKCGGKSTPTSFDLKSGNTRSCGCRKRNTLGESTRKHGKTGTKEYRAWFNMRARCKYETRPDFARYGARGITVCKEWDKSFMSFFNDMGPCPKNFSLDRIDPRKNYEKDNCRWASQETQANNKKNVVHVSIGEETLPLSVWCRKLNLPPKTIRARVYQYGWNPVLALFTPVRKMKRR